MTFEQEIETRAVEVFADFFYPHLAADDDLLDCGCGNGALTVGLAQYVPEGSAVGIDLDADGFQPARGYLAERGISNVRFEEASMFDLPFEPETFSACFCHSSLETLSEPVHALREVYRVLEPGGLIGADSVEYEGLLLNGPQEPLLRKFYAVREELWRLESLAEPRFGKRLRGLLHEAGFVDAVAHARYVCHGSSDDIAAFGHDRAAECEDEWYVEKALEHQLLSRTELTEIQAAWQNWASAPDAFAAFTWCRAIGKKPT